MEGVFLHLATWLSLAGGVWGLFALAENTVRPEVRASVSQWLRNPGGALERWPATFAKVFDSVFGERHFSWRCFSRSCAASVIGVLIVVLIWGALRPKELGHFLRWEHWGLGAYMLVAVLSNLIPDYLSLLESRYIIRSMERGGYVSLLTLLLLDFVLTVVIALVVFFIVISQFVPPEMFKELMLESVLPLRALPTGSISLPTLGMFFYSTFFTSVWVWLYALSALAVRLVASIGRMVGRLDRVIDIDNKPLHTIGLVWGLLVTLGYLGMLVLL